MGQVDTKVALWYDNINYNVMIYFVVHFILIIIPNIDCMHLMSLQHNDEPKDDAPQPSPPPKQYTRVKKRKIVNLPFIIILRQIGDNDVFCEVKSLYTFFSNTLHSIHISLLLKSWFCLQVIDMVSLICYLVQILGKLAHAVVSWTPAPHCLNLLCT